ncbi:unnamed protein product [Dovyalis caffra]|uniref:Uncharacterized protein n=1 Tax=Dovyalis caffra TaxID=77055 RepID=A0AAV1SBF0_9ROSI|nr:unnamed protein product [Dovyalis caffra]
MFRLSQGRKILENAECYTYNRPRPHDFVSGKEQTCLMPTNSCSTNARNISLQAMNDGSIVWMGLALKDQILQKPNARFASMFDKSFAFLQQRQLK